MLSQGAGRTGFPLSPMTPESYRETSIVELLGPHPIFPRACCSMESGPDSDGCLFYPCPCAATLLGRLEEGGGKNVTHGSNLKLGQGHMLEAGGDY